MAVYGILAFDISNDVKRCQVWRILRKKVIRATKSVMIFDFSLKDEVQKVVSSHMDPIHDTSFPPSALHDEKEAQHWARMAMQSMFEEVVPSLKRRMDELMGLLDAEESEKRIETLDAADAFAKRIKDAKAKIDDAMIALTTFRLSGEFDELRAAKIAEMDAMEELFQINLVKREVKKQGQVA